MATVTPSEVARLKREKICPKCWGHDTMVAGPTEGDIQNFLCKECFKEFIWVVASLVHIVDCPADRVRRVYRRNKIVITKREMFWAKLRGGCR